MTILKKIKGKSPGVVIKLTWQRLKYYFFDIPKATRERRKNDGNKLTTNNYKKKKIRRNIKRFISEIINFGKIRKNKKARILIIVHFYYEKSADEIIEYLKNLRRYNFDLVVTCMDGTVNEASLAKFKKFKQDVRIAKYENRGYDIAPFIDVINKTDLDDYDIVIKMQSKNTDKAMFIYDQFFRGRDWFNNLWDGVLGCFRVHNTINKLCNNKNRVGLVAAKNLIISDPRHKELLVKETLDRYKKIEYVKDYKFVAGSCFAIRAKCLEKIKKADIKNSDFEKAQVGVFLLAHVIERAICFSVYPEYDVYGNSVDLVRRMKWRKAERKLRERSALNITKIDGMEFSPDFVWLNLELYFIEKAERVKIRLGDIKRVYFDGTIKNLKECEPYKYLQGDKKIYEQYVEYHKKNKMQTMTVDRYEKLIKSIKENGYLEKYPIVVDGKNQIIDGQHRACILMFEKGEDFEVEVIRFTPAEINLKKIKPLSDKID